MAHRPNNSRAAHSKHKGKRNQSHGQPGKSMGNKIHKWIDPEYYRERKGAMEKFEYFWLKDDIYSQWYRSKFYMNGMEFSCAEQYMMYCKAGVADDVDTQMKILSTNSPREMKKLGKTVKGLNHSLWEAQCIDVVRSGNVAKFSQNPHLREKLFATYPKVLVEASPYDKKWGIGLHATWKEAFHQDQWQGLNLLGFIISDVRDELMQDKDQSIKRTVDLEEVKDSLRKYSVGQRVCQKSSKHSGANDNTQQTSTAGDGSSQQKVDDGNVALSNDQSMDNKEGLGEVENETVYKKQNSVYGKFHFFEAGSPFSIDYLSPFRSEQDDCSFDSIRQLVVYRKAELFGDIGSKKKALHAENQKELEEVEKSIRTDDKRLWDEHVLDVYNMGNIIKFQKDEELQKKLFQTYPKTLAYAEPDDTLWGIGVDADDPVALQPEAWPGHNMLGLVLTAVRDELMSSKDLQIDKSEMICLRDLKQSLFDVLYPPAKVDQETESFTTIPRDSNPHQQPQTDKMKQMNEKSYPGHAETGDQQAEDDIAESRDDGPEVQPAAPSDKHEALETDEQTPRVEETEAKDKRSKKESTKPQMVTDLNYV